MKPKHAGQRTVPPLGKQTPSRITKFRKGEPYQKSGIKKKDVKANGLRAGTC